MRTQQLLEEKPYSLAPAEISKLQSLCKEFLFISTLLKRFDFDIGAIRLKDMSWIKYNESHKTKVDSKIYTIIEKWYNSRD